MGRKLSIIDVQREFKERGYVFLDDFYEGVDFYHNCLCVCGEKDKKCLSAVRANKKCKKCVKKRMSGSNNPNYNPNLTDEEREHNRDYPEYVEWAKTVKDDDEYCCYLCGLEGVRLVSHHILPFSKYPERRTSLENGITLCETCHKQFHRDTPLSKVSLKSLLSYEETVWPTPNEKEIDYDEYNGYYFSI